MRDEQRRAMFARLNNRGVAKAFAQGATSGKTKHMFIEGDKIYSYGHHFPIARRIEGNKVYFTTQRYSPTTSHHKSLVEQELAHEGYNIIKKENVDSDELTGAEAQAELNKVRTASKEDMEIVRAKQKAQEDFKKSYESGKPIYNQPSAEYFLGADPRKHKDYKRLKQ
jgi:hypothetical protein